MSVICIDKKNTYNLVFKYNFYSFQNTKELKLMVENVLRQGLEGLVLKDLTVRGYLIFWNNSSLIAIEFFFFKIYLLHIKKSQINFVISYMRKNL